MPTFIELFKEGRKLKDEAKYDEAIAVLQQAADLEEKTSMAWQATVQCHTELGRHAEAIEVAKKCVAREPDDQFAYISLSRAYQRGGFIPEAEYAMAQGQAAMFRSQQKR